MEQMIMANYKYRKLLLAVLLVIGTSNAKASFGQLNEKGYSISNCLNLVEGFYAALSVASTNSAPEIFDADTLGYRKMSSEREKFERWQYACTNSGLFVSRSAVEKMLTPLQFYQRAGKRLSVSLSQNDIVEVVVWGVDSVKEGVIKEVAFPIVMDERTGEFRIHFLNIRSNGVYIDPFGDFIRDH